MDTFKTKIRLVGPDSNARQRAQARVAFKAPASKAGDRLKVQQQAPASKMLMIIKSNPITGEACRISGVRLFQYNLLDPSLYISVVVVFTFCKLIFADCKSVSFILTFGSIFFLINHQIDAYRSFKAVRQNIKILSLDEQIRGAFMSAYLGSGYNNPSQTSQTKPDECPAFESSIKFAQGQKMGLEYDKQDSFKWINKLIVFFWPSLSRVIHSQLDEFFEREIKSGQMSRSNRKLIRLAHAIITQFQSNVLCIEKFQLGRQTPRVEHLTIKESNSTSCRKVMVHSNCRATYNGGRRHHHHLRAPKTIVTNNKMIITDLDVHYNGDMNLTLICRNVCCFNSRIGLKDIFLKFRFRFVWGPIVKGSPFVNSMSITLLERPDFGYKGIALVELAQLKVARRLIIRLIEQHLLYPRMVSIDLKQLIEDAVNAPAQRNEPSPNVQTGPKSDETSCFTRLLARTLLQGCLCSNYCLRMCQGSDTGRKHNSTPEANPHLI